MLLPSEAEWEKAARGTDKYPYNPNDGLENNEAHDQIDRLTRGGAFYLLTKAMRCAFRYGFGPNFRDWHFGFRVVERPCR